MTDHKRLDALTGLVERSGAKLIAVGDGKQLPSIGPGGMFDRLAGHAPTAELADIHRTKDPADQRAWQALRAGEPERAMAHYASRGQLHLSDTRDQAAEQAVQTWASAHRGTRYPRGRVDRRRLQPGDRPAQRPRPTPPRTTRRTRTPRDPAARRPLRPTRRRPHRVHHPAPPAGAATGRERHPRPDQRHPRARRDRHARRITAPGPARPTRIWSR